MLVEVFTRQLTTRGMTYPAGALVPEDLFEAHRLRQLKDLRWVFEEDSDARDSYPEPFETVENPVELAQLASARAVVTALETDLDRARETLDALERTFRAADVTNSEEVDADEPEDAPPGVDDLIELRQADEIDVDQMGDGSPMALPAHVS